MRLYSLLKIFHNQAAKESNFIIKNGKFQSAILKEKLFSEEYFFETLRKNHVAQFHEVKFAKIEKNGIITIEKFQKSANFQKSALN